MLGGSVDPARPVIGRGVTARDLKRLSRLGEPLFLQAGALMRKLGLLACLRTSRVLRTSSKRVQHDGCLRAKCVEMIEDDRRCTRDCVMFKGAQEIA